MSIIPERFLPFGDLIIPRSYRGILKPSTTIGISPVSLDNVTNSQTHIDKQPDTEQLYL